MALKSANVIYKSASIVTNNYDKTRHISDDGISTAPTSLGQFMQQLMDSNRTSNKANVIATCHPKSMSCTYIATSNNGTWIVDSGASDHMTSDFQVFNTFKPCADSDSHTVRTADGSLSKVIGTGSVTLSNNLHLKSVLFVPTLSCNLLSISKLARDMNCIIKFYQNHCEFQVEGSEKVFGSAEMHDGLYILKDSHTSKQQKSTVGKHSNSVINSVAVSNENHIMLWHFRLGHPNFGYLERLFPHLFVHKSNLFDSSSNSSSKHSSSFSSVSMSIFAI